MVVQAAPVKIGGTALVIIIGIGVIKQVNAKLGYLLLLHLSQLIKLVMPERIGFLVIFQGLAKDLLMTSRWIRFSRLAKEACNVRET